jgi:FSR family fosmidomycin resistance protein-like MFS transporter
MKPAPAVLPLLLFAAGTHFLVDTVAGTLNPLWPLLDPHFHLAPWHSVALFLLFNATTSISQFFFGVYGDRFNGRWLLWAGPVAAIICLGSIGLTRSPLILANLLLISGLGIAAYHPEAAALAGSCAPEHRSRAMSVFVMGGFLGQAIGPVYSGNIVDRLGLPGLAWGIMAGLAFIALLLPLARGVAVHHARQPITKPSLAAITSAGIGPLLLVLLIGSLRIIAASGVPVFMGFMLAARQASAADIGFVQSAFMFGIGLGGLACATLLRPAHERLILWLCPVLAAPAVAVLPWAGGFGLAVLVCLSGLLLGVSLPVMISYGQQLMPQSQRIASSITMGVSWGLGGGAVTIVLAICRYTGRYDPAFILFAVTTLLSSLLCMWLPVVGREKAEVIGQNDAIAADPSLSTEY